MYGFIYCDSTNIQPISQDSGGINHSSLFFIFCNSICGWQNQTGDIVFSADTKPSATGVLISLPLHSTCIHLEPWPLSLLNQSHSNQQIIFEVDNM